MPIENYFNGNAKTFPVKRFYFQVCWINQSSYTPYQFNHRLFRINLHTFRGGHG